MVEWKEKLDWIEWKIRRNQWSQSVITCIIKFLEGIKRFQRVIDSVPLSRSLLSYIITALCFETQRRSTFFSRAKLLWRTERRPILILNARIRHKWAVVIQPVRTRGELDLLVFQKSQLLSSCPPRTFSPLPNHFLPSPPSKINESVEIVTAIELMIACHELHYCCLTLGGASKRLKLSKNMSENFTIPRAHAGCLLFKISLCGNIFIQAYLLNIAFMKMRRILILFTEN